MTVEGVSVRVTEKWNLYKWDASVGDNPPDPTKIDAASHPACAEIWEMQDGQPARLIYQRKD